MTRLARMRRLLAILLVAACAAAAAPPADAASGTLPEKQEQLRRVQRRLEEERQRLRQTRRRERRTSDEVQRLDRRREVTEDRLARLTTELRRARMRAEGAASALARAEMALARRRTLLAGRLVDLHRYGRAGYLDVVLGAATFPEFVTRARLVGAIIRADGRLIRAYTTDRDRTTALREALDVEQARLRALLGETEEQHTQLAEEVTAKRKALSGIVNERTAAERAVRDLEEDSTELEALIQRLQSRSGAGLGRSLAAFIWPLRGIVTSRFGFRRHPIFRIRQFHQGLDIAAAQGSPVRAAFAGVVLFAGWYGGYGKLVIIDHGQGTSTLYGHLSAILASPGQQVPQGHLVGRVGSTGYSTGPHLHFEVRQNGKPVDPTR
ncbi:MAG: murein hydrolase activator EnvC family protein [Armatimonadota bacterium]